MTDYEIAGAYLLGGAVGALGIVVVIGPMLRWFTSRTKSTLDDLLIANMRVPLMLTSLAIGVWCAAQTLILDDPYPWMVTGALSTVLAISWTIALAKTATSLLGWLIANQGKYASVNERTLPIFEISAKAVIWGGGIYFLFLAWEIDLTGWLASAGVIGVAVGFAAKDTLSNLIAGIFILADGPYKLGDYLVLPHGDRGEVIEIGIRTTRLRTRDDVEIIVPNAVMANSTIINQSGGPAPVFRLRIPILLAYGVELEEAYALLLEIASAEEVMLDEPAPRVRFRSLADSGLQVELLGWVRAPADRGRATHHILSRVYREFNKAGLTFPYPSQDIYLHHNAATLQSDDKLTAGSPDGELY